MAGSAQGSLGEGWQARPGGGFFEEERCRDMTHLRSMWARVEIIGKAQLLD